MAHECVLTLNNQVRIESRTSPHKNLGQFVDNQVLEREGEPPRDVISGTFLKLGISS